MASPPHDIDTERQILGALLVRSSLISEIDSKVKVNDFYLHSHRLIYGVVLEENRKGHGDIDAVQISQRLSDLSHIEEVGGAPYVLRLAQDVMAPGNAFHHAHRLKSLALRRQLMEAANQILNDSSQPVEDEASFLRHVEDSILRITNQDFGAGIVSMGEMREEFQDYIQSLMENQGRISGLETHFRDFDKLSSGLKEGELIVIAARPGLGKTTFALNLAANVVTQSEKAVLLYSLEMSQVELMMRLVCAESEIHHEHLKRGQVSAARQNDLRLAMDKLCRSPLYIDDSGDLTIWDCMARTRKFKIDLEQKGQKLGLIIVDYLQLMSDPDARRMGRQHEVATISRCLKQLARIVRTPIIAVSQMNRSVEQRRGEASRPQLSDLRESGAIEQDADIVMFIHHDVQGDEGSEDMVTEEDLSNRGTVEMVIAKNRNGPIGNFRLVFRPHVNKFRSTDAITSSVRTF